MPSYVSLPILQTFTRKSLNVRFYFFHFTRYLHEVVFDLFITRFGQLIIDIFMDNQALST